LAAQTAPDMTDGERKTVTALFADIKGSTELMRDLDPEEARAIIDPGLNLMIHAVHRYDGYVVQSTGDGIFALFGAPVAHEDHPQRALRAAVAMRDEHRRSGEDLNGGGFSRIQIRIGINTGEVVMRTVRTSGHTEYSPVGHVINLAARMQNLAPPNGIVLTEETRCLVEGYFKLRGLGPMEVKGVNAPVNIYEVVGAGSLLGHFELAAHRGLTKFVGRKDELQQMQRTLDHAIGGHGQIVAAVGEAGAGKSRLIYEFEALLPGECKLLKAYSVSHGKASAYLPVLALLYDYFDIKDADQKVQRRDKVEGRLSALDPALNDTLPFLCTLMGLHEGPDPLAQMDPQVKRRRILEAIKRIIFRESLNQPMVLTFEDLHWIDSETQALLDLLADSIGNSRILLLVNYRPEYRHEWNNKSYYSQLRLDALGREGAGEMLSALLGDGAELNPLKRLIIQRAEGNPFFIEEMVQALFDEGALVRDGAVKVTRSLSQVRLPHTVKGILASRIDRLPSDQKQLLQTLAVIGRESPLGLISQVTCMGEAQLERMLSDLQRGEFVYEQPAAEGVEFIFKHALTHEVAYNALLIERRKLIHERAAQAIETLFASSLVNHYVELAHHYSRSSNTGKAIEYLRLAGQQAVQRSANTAAITHFNDALALLLTRPATPERTAQELSLWVALGPSLQASKGWAATEVEQAYSRALELSQGLREMPQLFSALFGLQAFYAHRGKLQTARELAERALGLAQSAEEPALLLQAHHLLGYSLVYAGELTLAREHTERVIALYDSRHHSLSFLYGGDDPAVCCLSHRALALWALGYPDQALKSTHDALSLAQRLSHPLSAALALAFAAILHQFRRDRQTAQECADAAITLATDQGFPYFLAWGIILQGWALTEQGQGEGIARIRQGLAVYQATGAQSFRPYHLALLAERFRAAEQTDEELVAVAEALTWVDKNNEYFYEAELYRLKGELLLKRDDSNIAEAQSCFDRAIEIARNQSAKTFQLRATMSLARLLAKQGQRVEARTMLADIYDWFTEGFDTADLKDAKALLDELGN
jgi:predicted ATPase/class 3 adenylate cyclase